MKKNSDICTILYTTGTIGDPKGVLIFNNSIAYIVAAANHFLQGVPEHVSKYCICFCTQYISLACLHSFCLIITHIY